MSLISLALFLTGDGLVGYIAGAAGPTRYVVLGVIATTCCYVAGILRP